MWPNRKFCSYFSIHWIHAQIHTYMQYSHHNIGAIYLCCSPSKWFFGNFCLISSRSVLIKLLFFSLFYSCAGMECSKKGLNNTKWTIQFQPHINRVRFRCLSKGDDHRHRIQIVSKNWRRNRIEKRILYDIRLLQW